MFKPRLPRMTIVTPVMPARAHSVLLAMQNSSRRIGDAERCGLGVRVVQLGRLAMLGDYTVDCSQPQGAKWSGGSPVSTMSGTFTPHAPDRRPPRLKG